jgi:hypothetical protein
MRNLLCIRCQRPATTRPTTLHVYKTRGCQCSFRLMMMGGVSPETCWASCKYEIKILIECCILLDFLCEVPQYIISVDIMSLFLRLYLSRSRENVVRIKTGLDDKRFDSLREKRLLSYMMSSAVCGPIRLVFHGYHGPFCEVKRAVGEAVDLRVVTSSETSGVTKLPPL